MPFTQPVAATTGTDYVDPASVLDRLEPGRGAGTLATNPAGAGAFAAALGGVVDSTQALQSASNQLAIAAVTGDLDDIHDATIAATRAQLTLETVAAIRNKAVDAFNTIMNMQA